MRHPAVLSGSLLLVAVLSGAAGPRVTHAAPAAGPRTPVSAAPVDVARDSGSVTGDVDTEVASALEALSRHVTRSSHPEALRTAFRAYFNYRAAHPDRVRKPFLYYVDYGLGNTTARGYVFDMESHRLIDGPFTVAHGRGSSRTRNGVPMTFGNRSGSAMTSLGLFLTQETYGFSGSANGRRYRSVGLRMAGLSGRFNDAARSRGVVAHGAPYVSAGDAGRSEGCPAMEERRAQRLLPLIADGALVFLYSPNDENWLDHDPWAGEA